MNEYTAKKQKTIIAVLLFLLGVAVQLSLQELFRPYALDKLYYFPVYPSSETMMQTVSIIDLRDSPFESLWNIHIQPPGFDLIRAGLAQFWIVANPNSFNGDAHSLDLLHQVDRSLYFLFALLYGALGGIIFLWSAEKVSLKFSAVGAVLFLVHPASIFYATLLDSTFISSLMILLTFYLLWRQQHDPSQPIWYLVVATLCLFFTRSIFQWPFIFVMAFSLALIRANLQKIVIFTLVCGVVMSAYLEKQYLQFGIFNSSSFTGYNLTKSVDMKISASYWSKLPDKTEPKYNLPDTPDVLIRERKLTGTRNFNHMFYLELNQKLTDSYATFLKSADRHKLFENYLNNAWIYFLPSSQYGKHEIVDRLPWRNFYDRLFSYPILPGLLFLMGVYWLITTGPRGYVQGIAYLLPFMYIFLASVLLEKGENARFKFFLESVMYVFMLLQIHSMWLILQNRVFSKVGTQNEI